MKRKKRRGGLIYKFLYKAKTKNMETFIKHIEKILKADDRLWSKDDDKKLLKNKLVELVSNDDEELLELLLNDLEAKKHFFKKIKDSTIFLKDRFLQFITMNEFLPDSFTAFENEIGLSDDKKLITQKDEISLIFPHKDCILEGGQTKEEVGRDEIFYNTILAPDEIDRIKEPKVLVNWKRYDKEGSHEVKEISKQDNLIIKGNNLLALYSLLPKYRGEVKLIYIDPPFNTQNDSFKYNDKFNHSTWLIFMQNRLEVARELLADDGAIYVHLDYNEVHYCKILIDGIFGKENFRRDISLSTGWPLGFKTAANNWIKGHDSILFYSKSDKYKFKKLYKEYRVDYESRARKDKDGRLWVDQSLGNISKAKLAELKKHGIAYQTKTGNWRKKQYLDEMMGELITDMWIDIDPINSQSKEKEEFDGQKPEALLQRIIESSTDKGDIVLDYHAGTGTTGAVAHKMGRRYILIEQMDYIHDLPEARLINVISGDQTGISKAVNWKGGGSFIYTELLEWNQKYVSQLEKAKTQKEILDIYKKIEKEQFYKYKYEPKKFDLKKFKELDLKEQKKALLDILDMNHLYVNKSSINDATFKVDEKDKKLTKMFYEEK